MAPVAPQIAAPNPQLVWEPINSYQRTVALRAAIYLDLFTTVREGIDTVQSLATRRTTSLGLAPAWPRHEP
jgi:hypothetical protein